MFVTMPLHTNIVQGILNGDRSVSGINKNLKALKGRYSLARDKVPGKSKQLNAKP
jgi:hypothetical protein